MLLLEGSVVRYLPAWRKLRLSFVEREEISRGLVVGESMRCSPQRLQQFPLHFSLTMR